MYKIYDKVKAEVVETVIKTFEDSIQTSYSDSTQVLKSAMNTIEQDFALTIVVQAGRGPFIDEMQSDRLIKYDSLIKQIVKSILSSTTFIVSMADLVQKQVDKSFPDQWLNNMEGTSALTIPMEFLHKCFSPDQLDSSKSVSGNENRDRCEHYFRCHWLTRRWMEKKGNSLHHSTERERQNGTNLPVTEVAVIGDRRLAVVETAEAIPVSPQWSFSQLTHVWRLPGLLFWVGQPVSTIWRWCGQAHPQNGKTTRGIALVAGVYYIRHNGYSEVPTGL